ncbi:hypothetical protein EDD85DRAFT_936180 [Armillaria nabsnona]|nr:hypothetical protein EDD85DRAFT_936180 [Armillaria nabsnona]
MSISDTQSARCNYLGMEAVPKPTRHLCDKPTRTSGPRLTPWGGFLSPVCYVLLLTSACGFLHHKGLTLGWLYLVSFTVICIIGFVGPHRCWFHLLSLFLLSVHGCAQDRS